MEEEKKQHGGRRAGAGRPRNKEGQGKQLYFRFRCSQRVFDIIHMHEEDGMSEWVEKAILEKARRDELI